MRPGILAALVLAVSGCSRPEATATAMTRPTPGTKSVDVVVTPIDSVEAETLATPPPEIQTSSVILTIPTPAPTVDVGSIPNMDREKRPTPENLTEQMQQCLSFSVAVAPTNALIAGGIPGRQLAVRVVNSCDVTFSAADSWFEARGKSPGGAVLGRQVGRFQQDLRARSSAETLIQLDNCCNDGRAVTFEASVWWAAGGGKSPGR